MRHHLEDCIWQRPDSYAGFSPDGHYIIVSCTRDSDALDLSNWYAAGKLLAAADLLDSIPQDDSSQPVYEWRASHWACGWIDYLMVRPDAPQAVLDCAADIIASLTDYPALDEDDWSAREWTDASDYWAGASIRERMDIIRQSRSDASLFAARRDHMPDDNGAVYEWLRS